MKIYTTSREDYLKAVLALEKQNGEVHSVDVARYLGVSKPSVSREVSVLEESGLLTMEKDYSLHFTEEGRKIAEKTYDKHQFFKNRLLEAGVDSKTAAEDACRLEHAISDTSFEKLKRAFEEQNVKNSKK